MKLRNYLIGLGVLLLSTGLQAGEWKNGIMLSYVSGSSDVLDLYEDNLIANGYYIEDEVEGVPIGIGYRGKYQADSGFRVDIGVGPLMILFGDVDHTELPVTGTVGFDFAPNSPVSPYIRLGAAYHIVSGDDVDKSNVGAFAAFGIEFSRGPGFFWGLEVSVDDSTVDFDRYNFGSFTVDTVELNTYDTQLSLYFMF
ncbi:hypothetical protein NBRC116493_24330 [Aurantivibrio infirmus]